MKTSKTILVGILSVGLVGLAATTCLACHGGRSYSGYSSHYSPQYVERAYITEVAPPMVAPTFAPAHSVVAVMPGDTWPSICQREYGNPGVWSKIAEFNGIPQNMQLNPGMQLRLPVVNPNGSFSISSAPAAMPPQGFVGGMPQGQPQGMPQGFAGGMPQGQQGFPQGMPQGFAGQMPQGQPQGVAGGMPQGQPQGLPQGMTQGFAGGMPQGMQQTPQGNFAGPQGGMPQANGSVQQIQAMPPQQTQMGPPQAMQPGQPMQQTPPQNPMASQGPEAGPDNLGSIAGRIADQVTGLSDLLSSRPANPNSGPTDRPLPSILIGSLMTINGQQLGDNRGTVRLTVNGSPVPLEIVEWSANSAKVRIPADLPPGIQAQIEILRADGSVVAKDPVQLAAGQTMAAAN
jgi:hypothetical protein